MRNTLPFIALLTAVPIAACGSSPTTTDTETAEETTSALGLESELDGLGPFINAYGLSQNLSTTGSIDNQNEFFQSLGTNGRACVTCHVPADGFSITPARMQVLFDVCELLGTHATGRAATACAVFRTNDGSNSPNAKVATRAEREKAYSLLLSKALIRIPLSVPATAEFEVIAVDDPYGYATTTNLSLYRRPLMATDLTFNATVMWDGRETAFFGEPLNLQLMSQANDATLGHAQAAAPLTPAQQASIVGFELALFSAQTFTFGAGALNVDGATGGPVALSTEPFFFGENSPPPPTPNDPNAFTDYTAWAGTGGLREQTKMRESIARGEVLFNTRSATGQPGFTCTACHDAFNAGSLPLPVFIPAVAVSEAAFRTPDLPLYTLRNKTTGEIHTSTDPGRALITGAWADVNSFKTPVLRNLAQRAPYFHNGSAATLGDVVDHYGVALGFSFTASEKTDLVNFMSAL